MSTSRSSDYTSGDSKEKERIKLVVVGDGTVGKTCLLVTFVENKFPQEYVPTIFEKYLLNFSVDGASVELDLWDTAGQETYDRIRPLSYPNTQVFLICFNVMSPVSFENVASKWIPEIKSSCPEASVVLVGTKSDLRYDSSTNKTLNSDGKSPVKKAEAVKLAKKHKLYGYVECSAMTQEGLTKVYEEAVRSVIRKSKEKTKESSKVLCCFLGN